MESDRKDGTRKQSQKISGDGKPNSYSCPLLWSNRPQSPKDLFQTTGGKSLHQLTHIGVHVRVVFQKGWFWRMFARNENRNEGTFGCSPGTKTGTRVHSHVPSERKLERGHIRQNHSPSLAAQSAPCREAKAPPSPEPTPAPKERGQQKQNCQKWGCLIACMFPTVEAQHALRTSERDSIPCCSPVA